MSTSFVGGLLSLHAETPVHAGTGAALGVVDLPIQRERHTHFPTVPGTSIKGVLRDAARGVVARGGGSRKDADRSDEVVMLFGGSIRGEGGEQNAAPAAGALAISDARVLAFPVRSLKGVFAWVTCPAVLARLDRDARLVGLEHPAAPGAVKPGKALVTSSDLVIDGHVVLEEYDFETMNDSGPLQALARFVADKLLPTDKAWQSTRERFVKAVCLLSDDDFSNFVRHSTEVVARIGLDRETKTVAGGALFYQELLPAETLLYSVVMAEASRAGAAKLTAVEVFERFRQKYVLPVLQVGGDETVGRGICSVRCVPGGAA